MNNFDQGRDVNRTGVSRIENLYNKSSGKLMSEKEFIEKFNKNLSCFFGEFISGTINQDFKIKKTLNYDNRRL